VYLEQAEGTCLLAANVVLLPPPLWELTVFPQIPWPDLNGHLEAGDRQGKGTEARGRLGRKETGEWEITLAK